MVSADRHCRPVAACLPLLWSGCGRLVRAAVQLELQGCHSMLIKAVTLLKRTLDTDKSLHFCECVSSP